MEKKKKHKKTRKGIISLLLFSFNKFYKCNKTLMIALILINILNTFVPLIERFINAYAIQTALDDGISNGQITGTFWFSIIVVLGFLATSAIMSAISTFTNQYAEIVFPLYFDQTLLPKYLSLDPKTFDNPKFITKKTKIDWNLWQIRANVMNSIYFLSQLILLITSGLVLARANLWYIGVIIVSQIPNAYSTIKFGTRVWNIWNSSSTKKILFNLYRRKLFTIDLEEFQEMKVLNYGKYLLNKALTFQDKFNKDLIANEKKRLVFNILSTIWEYAFIGLIVFSIFKQFAMSGVSNISNFYIVWGTTFSFIWTVNKAIYNLSSIQSNRNILASFYNLMTQKKAIKNGSIKIETTKPIFIEFKNVCFKYPNTKRWIINDISFKIKSNEDIALVGQNGAGKTTLIKLLLRIYDIQKGEILINGIDIKDIDLNSYYRTVGILSQNFNRFGIKAGENIYLGDTKRKYNLQEIKEAADSAKANNFITKYPQKYDTFLTKQLKGGILPSGGQWQRIAIARIFFRKPKLLILDEPTSSIDSIAEEQIFNNLQTHSKNRTVIIVSHRLATIRKAKRIIVLQEGKIIEDGNHQELLTNNGLYKTMYTKQKL